MSIKKLCLLPVFLILIFYSFKTYSSESDYFVSWSCSTFLDEFHYFIVKDNKTSRWQGYVVPYGEVGMDFNFNEIIKNGIPLNYENSEMLLDSQFSKDNFGLINL